MKEGYLFHHVPLYGESVQPLFEQDSSNVANLLDVTRGLPPQEELGKDEENDLLK